MNIVTAMLQYKHARQIHKNMFGLSRGSNPRAKRWDYCSVDKIEPLRPAAFVLKLLRDWTRNRALTDDIARTINIYYHSLL